LAWLARNQVVAKVAAYSLAIGHAEIDRRIMERLRGAVDSWKSGLRLAFWFPCATSAAPMGGEPVYRLPHDDRLRRRFHHTDHCRRERPR
jgi:hypothetical protein